MKLDEEWPDHFEERTRPSRNRMEEEGQRKHDAMANMVARPQSLQDYLHDQLGWFDLAPDLRAMADRIIYNLDSNGYLPSEPGRPARAARRADRGQTWNWPGEAPGAGAEARPAGRRRPRPARVPAVAAHARHAATTSSCRR